VQLTDREIKIIYLLLNRNDPITIQKLSELYGVSIRTIKYDLKDIKACFKENEKLFQSKPHVGIWITNDLELRETIRKKLLGQTGFEYYPDPQKRILQIAFLLSLTDQPVYIFSFWVLLGYALLLIAAGLTLWSMLQYLRAAWPHLRTTVEKK